MATIQSLKKKLQVVRSTRKITQAMKTASTVKYSKLTGLFSAYAEYCKQYKELYKVFCDEFNARFSDVDFTAPVCYVVISSNKGMCGSFNNELFNFFLNIISKDNNCIILSCGKKGNEFFSKKGIKTEKNYVFSDIPQYHEAEYLFGDIQRLIDDKKISSVKVVYPEYKNMIKQTPVICEFFGTEKGDEEHNEPLFVPDKETVFENFAEKVIATMLYKTILEAALGAQAATLTTMRSAFDTASDYCVQLEAEINRKRQSQVTADVLEVSAEYSVNWEE